MIKIGICDDDVIAIRNFQTVLENHMNLIGKEFKLYTFKTSEELLFFMGEKLNYLDLLFLDIELQEANGIELSKQVHHYQPECQIAFNTNYIEYAPDVYETEHCYYILKSQIKERLPSVISKVCNNIRQKEEIGFVPVKGGLTRVVFSRVLYIERSARKTCIHLEDDEKIEIYLKLDELLDIFSSLSFVRCHASFIISFTKIQNYTRQQFTLKNGMEIPISRKYVKEVKEKFGKWSGSQL